MDLIDLALTLFALICASVLGFWYHSIWGLVIVVSLAVVGVVISVRDMDSEEEEYAEGVELIEYREWLNR